MISERILLNDIYIKLKSNKIFNQHWRWHQS
jgi:hypothetical protein